MRKPVVILLTVATLTFVTACGTSGGDDSASKTTTTAAAKTTTTEAETTTTTDVRPVDVWAREFCGNFTAWTSKIKAAGNKVSAGPAAGDVQGAKGVIVSLFQTASDETQTLITSLEAGGAPDITDGDQLVADLTTKFHHFDDAITAATDDAKNLPVDDTAAFKAQVKVLIKTFDTETTSVGRSFGELDSKYRSPELQTALTAHCDL